MFCFLWGGGGDGGGDGDCGDMWRYMNGDGLANFLVGVG